MPTVDIVVGYDRDGRAHEVFFVDGRRCEINVCDLDPDARMLRHGHRTDWLASHGACTTRMSPQAAEQVRRWAHQTAEFGYITPDNEEAT